jgi:hypothetical protein
LTQNSLSLPNNYRELRDLFIDVAKRPQQSPYQCPVEPLNVNNDDCITPLDALLVINDLGKYENGVLPPLGAGQTPAAYVDVTGDGVVAPLDALRVINQLGNVTTCNPIPSAASAQGGELAGDLPANEDQPSLDWAQQSLQAASMRHRWSGLTPDPPNVTDAVFAELGSHSDQDGHASQAAAADGQHANRIELATRGSWNRANNPPAAQSDREEGPDVLHIALA